MPMEELSVADQRLAFVLAVRKEGLSITDACEFYGISRPTGYKVLRRYDEEGVAGFLDHSRAPRHCPHAVDDAVVQEILGLKADHPRWGPKKLKAYWERKWAADSEGERRWPATSTVGEILKRAGLVGRRSRKSRANAPTAPILSRTHVPNQVWCADYKGEFRLGNGQWCYPLTITDLQSRYVLCCQALPNVSVERTWPYFVGVFQQYGLPEVLRTDNGVPFAIGSLTGLTQLSLNLIQLGIVLERIQPGKPQQNGTHERMHRTLKAESLPEGDHRAQQRHFDFWRSAFNEERPHEALGLRPPASVFTPSLRPFPTKIPSLEANAYPEGMKVHKVRPCGAIRWRGKELFICNLLTGQHVALDHYEERHHALYVGIMPLAILDETLGTFLPHKDAAPHLRRLRRELLIQRNLLDDDA